MERTFKKTAVIGAGAWDTALAFTAAQDGSVYIDGRKYVLTNDYEKETVADFLDGMIEKYRQQVKVL